MPSASTGTMAIRAGFIHGIICGGTVNAGNVRGWIKVCGFRGMCYKSKVDWWIAVVLLIAPVLPAVLAIYERRLFILAISFFVLLLYGLILLPLSYETSQDAFIIRSGVIRTLIPYSEIHRLRESRSPLSSPALSLDRVEVGYAQDKSVLISPKDKVAFLKDMNERIQQNSVD
jgi:membrane protein YdbS with pleckstrin-like domain